MTRKCAFCILEVSQLCKCIYFDGIKISAISKFGVVRLLASFLLLYYILDSSKIITLSSHMAAYFIKAALNISKINFGWLISGKFSHQFMKILTVFLTVHNISTKKHYYREIFQTIKEVSVPAFLFYYFIFKNQCFTYEILKYYV